MKDNSNKCPEYFVDEIPVINSEKIGQITFQYSVTHIASHFRDYYTGLLYISGFSLLKNI